MALSKKISLLCSIAALLPFTHAAPSNQNTLEDNDDTPLPLVIWHGTPRHPALPVTTPSFRLTDMIPLQA